jgi:RNA polymerase sigma-70 factor (ECF subfamily)
MTEAASRFKDALLAEIPSLRAFAISLTGSADRADDLVQETLMKAWGAAASFQDGTSLKAWLFTIMRNALFSQYRKNRREVQDVDGAAASRLTANAEQHGHLDLADFRTALATLPLEQREVLILVAASGFSYEEAAEISNCAVGTVKSRLNRARHHLTQLLSEDRPESPSPVRSDGPVERHVPAK